MRPIRIVRAAALGVALYRRDRLRLRGTRSSVPSGGARGNGASLLPLVATMAVTPPRSSRLRTTSCPATWTTRRERRLRHRPPRAHDHTRGPFNGNEANGPTLKPPISANGRVVAFVVSKVASNLVPGDNNNVSDVFMHDRSTGNTARISVNAGGAQGNGPSSPSVSATGQIVSFHSTRPISCRPTTTTSTTCSGSTSWACSTECRSTTAAQGDGRPARCLRSVPTAA